MNQLSKTKCTRTQGHESTTTRNTCHRNPKQVPVLQLIADNPQTPLIVFGAPAKCSPCNKKHLGAHLCTYNLCSFMMCWLMILTAFVLPGCEHRHKPDVDVLAYGPDTETIAVMTDYASQAIETTGGLQAWAKTKKLQLHCVATFYQPDNSFYLTEHYYEVYPWSNSIRISAREPQGKVICQLSPDKFSVVEGSVQFYSLPAGLETRLFAEMILDITTAAARLLDKSVEFTRGSRPVKIKGLWYYPIERTSSDVESYWSKVVFYQNRDTSLVEMLWFADVDEEKFFVVRGYNYHEIEKRSIRIPTRIEIFRTDAAGRSQKRLARVVCSYMSVE